MRVADQRQADPPRSTLVPVLRSVRSRIRPLRLATVIRYTGVVSTRRSDACASNATPGDPSIAAATAAATPASTDPKNAWVRRGLFALAVLVAICTPAQAAPQPTGSFVARSGTHLVLDGRVFRFGGANIEWLGLAGYGPADPVGPHYPSNFEIDDALSTARELG